MPHTISISTITLARDEAEKTLLRESLQALAALQVPVFVCDGGSGAGFLDFLRSFPQFILVPQQKGVWQQAQSSLHAAFESKAEFIFYTEPDKLNFFTSALPGFLKQEIAENTGVILASRSEVAFKTFPAFQQMTETTINNCCEEIVGERFDYTYGPFLLNSRLIPYLQLVKDEIGWGWRPFVFGVAKRLGYNIKNIEGDYVCPPDQRTDDKAGRLYRMRQLQQNIQGIVLSQNVKVL